MPELVQIGVQPSKPDDACAPKARPRTQVFWLQGVTLAWMLVEFGLLAFGSDSLVELMSATVVLMQWIPSLSISERKATRTASVLLFVLAFVVGGTALTSLVLRLRPETSRAGIGITAAALVAMPVLAWLKRREGHRSGNTALAADAAQSATCAYLALIALVGLAGNAFFHIAWFDAVAALVAIPVLIKEGRSAWRGQTCGCC
jgi:divalent metal cation (Fe/Co/Zn/Cd) transporter